MSRVTEEMTNCIEWLPHHELTLSYNIFKLKSSFLAQFDKVIAKVFLLLFVPAMGKVEIENIV